MAAAARYQPRYTQATAVLVTAVTLLFWLGMHTLLPLSPEPDQLYGWGADQWTWSLGGIWLVLLLAVLLLGGQSTVEVRQRAADELQNRFPKHGLILLLGGVTAVTLWAGTPALLVTAWLALALVWAGIGFAGWPRPALRAVGAPLVGLLLAVLILWYGAALGGGADWATWPAAARTAALLAVLLQLSGVPLLGRRLIAEIGDRETAVLPLLAPGLAGAALLARLVATGPMPSLLAATLLALLLVLGGLRRAWASLTNPALFGMALALVVSGFLVLGGMWAGPAALVAEGRVLALAVGALFLAGPVRRDLLTGRDGWLRYGLGLLSWMLALAALAGLPLTAGFNGRAPLYQSWLAMNGWALVLVTVLLHVPLITAVFLFGLARRDDTVNARPGLAASGGRLLLALGLLALPALPLGAVNWATWLALLLPVAAGLLLARWSPEMPDWETAVRLPANWSAKRLRQAGQLTMNAVRDAAELLEGERGLLWLLLLAVLIVLASSG